MHEWVTKGAKFVELMLKLSENRVLRSISGRNREEDAGG
jgi:hypothetical protein